MALCGQGDTAGAARIFQQGIHACPEDPALRQNMSWLLLDGKAPLGSSELLNSCSAISNTGHMAGIGYFPAISSGDVGFLLILR